VNVMRRIRIKMCGTTSEEDALAAIAAGVDALGFIFVAGSPRLVSPDRAAALIDTIPPFISRVGVFQDAAEAEIKEIVDHCGLTQVQLHGDESPEYCERLHSWRRGLSICKAVRVGIGIQPGDIQVFNASVDSILLDTYVRGTAGGTGQSFDWTIVESLGVTRPLILAGGLHPGNVVQAIRVVRPYAIDINSGVEMVPGRKDHLRLRQLIANVRRFESESD
jgi:phosphoribosylanthranilate isomerase